MVPVTIFKDGFPLLMRIYGSLQKSSPYLTISVSTANDCQQCFEELEKQVEAIPTLEDLREKYL